MQVQTYTPRPDEDINLANLVETIAFVKSVITVIKEINYDNHIKLLKKQKQKEKRGIVKQFQSELKDELNRIPELAGWLEEEKISPESKDSLDLSFKITLDSIPYRVIIELDASRGDQIAKKFVSRTSLTINDATIYFAFCYPGTEKMPDSDFKKILRCCQDITLKLNTETKPRLFVGLIAVHS